MNEEELRKALYDKGRADVLDKIGAEIYELPTYHNEIHRPNSVVFREMVEFDKVLRILDKYKE